MLTFNTWLLRLGRWTVARELARRAARIPEAVEETGADVVALQEVWPAALAGALVDRFRALGYVHAVSGAGRAGARVLGDGLLVVSRHPISPGGLLTFSGGRAWFESLISKGALAAEVALPWGDRLRLVTAHPAVVRFDFARGVFRAVDRRARRRQLEQLAAWIDSLSDAVPHLVVAADLNTIDRVFEDGCYQQRPAADYQALLEWLRLADAFREGDPRGDGFTFDPRTNPYAARGRCRRMPSERIDYVLYRTGTGIRVESASVVFRDPPHLSDHFGVLAELRFD